MTATAEDLVTTLKANHNPLDLARSMGVVKEGFEDLVVRTANGEHGHLENAHRLDVLEHAKTDSDAALAALARDREDFRKRVVDLEKSPVDLSARLDALEKRLRTAEGALGAANIKPAPAPVSTDPLKAADASGTTIGQKLGLTAAPKAPEPVV